MIYYLERRTQSLSAEVIHSLSPRPHIHPHLELIYLTEGSSYANADNTSFLLEAGDLFLSFPNQIHFYHVQIPLRGYMLIFSPDLFSDFESIFQDQIPIGSVLKAPQLPSDIEKRLAKIVATAQSDLLFDSVSAKGNLLTLLADILSQMQMTESPANQGTIKNLLTYCVENYTEPLTLDMVSEQLHMSKYYICHIFKERMGIGFAMFINQLRIAHACNLLEKNCNITDVAYSSGFSSIRTFNRVFFKSMGMTPRDYIAIKQTSLQ
jgi:AraC-like DNA-binding protein